MKQIGRLASSLAAILFAVFLLNVFLGAARMGIFMSDITEMLTLFGACIFFVIAVLVQERMQNEENTDPAG